MRFAVPAVVRSFVLPVFWAFVLVAGADAQILFQQPTVIPTGNWPVFVATADVNKDGFPDLIYIDAGATASASTTHILLGDGKGGFSPYATSASMATAGASVAIGDFAGNGKVDIAWLTSPAIGSVVWHYAPVTSTGTFSATVDGPVIPINTTVRSQFAYLQAAQIRTGTGVAQDIVAVDLASPSVFSFPTQPIGLLVTYTALAHGAGPVTVADLNGDGRDDIIVDGLTDNTAQIYLAGGNAGQAFNSSTGTVFAGLTGVRSLLAQDVDGDGRKDLIVEGAAGHIDVFFGNGDGTFNATSAGGTGPLDGTTGNGGHLIAAADLNGDQRLDAIAATPAGMSVLLGNGTQYLGLGGIYNAGPGHTSYATADFNGDGYLDVAVDSPEGIAILYGNSDGSFQSSKAYAAGQPALSGALGAFTTGGNLDAVVSTGATQAQLLHGNGDGTFLYAGAPGAPVPTTMSNGSPGLFGTVAVGDFDGDKKLDIAMTQDGGSQAAYGGVLLPATGSGLSIQYGNGDGTFGPVTPLTAAIPPEPSASGCQPPFAHFPGVFFGTSVVGDFNGDGITDIANLDVAAYRVMFGNGQRMPLTGFSDIDGATTEVDCDLDAHDHVAAGDLNGDGLPDFIFQDEGELAVFYNPGPSGSFTHGGNIKNLPGAPNLANEFLNNSTTFGVPTFIGSLVIADVNGDGKNDILALYDDLTADHQHPSAGAPNHLLIWKNNGNGTFAAPVTTTLSRNYYQLVVADLNGDGIPDLAMSDGYVLDVQYGVGDGTFGAETHYLAGQGINTISMGDVNGDGSVDLVVANGGVVFGNPVANKEVLAVNPDVNTGGITVLLNGIKTRVITGALTAAPEPSAYGAAFSITAALAVPAGGVAPTGTVAFSVDGTSVGTGNVSGTGATLAVPASLYATLAPGQHTLTASYSGDANYAANTGLTGTHTVSLAPTTVTLTPTTALRIYYGQAADGKFTITVVDSVNHPYTGTYTLQDNGVNVAICTNLPTTTLCPYGNPILLDVGIHAFTVVYNGDSFNAPSTSAAVTYTVIPDLTTGTLTTSLMQAAPGQAVTLSAAIAGNYAVPAGPIVFLDGTTPLATMTLDGKGNAVLTTTTLPLGLHVIKVTYAATLDFNAAATNSVNVLIVQPPVPLAVQVNLVSSANPSAPGQSVTFTASVTTPGPFITIPTGSITFLDGTTTLGTGILDQYGVARYSSATLAAGSHPMTASFAGNASSGANPPIAPPQPPVAPSQRSVQPRAQTQGIVAGVSAVLTQVVTTALPAASGGFILTVSPVPVTVGAGRTAVLLANVQELGGFAQAVNLTCSGLPTETTCTFLQTTIPPGGGSTVIQLSTMAPHDCDNPTSPYFLGSNTGLPGGVPPGPALGGLAVLVAAGLWQRKRLTKGLLAVLFAAGLAMLSGCGRCTDLGTKPGTYTFTVTAMGGGMTQSQDVQMTVTIP